MLAYPAYRIQNVDDELSWRQVGAMMEQWKNSPPQHLSIIRIEKMVEAATGTRWSTGGPSGHRHGTTETKDQLLDRIAAFGWSG